MMAMRWMIGIGAALLATSAVAQLADGLPPAPAPRNPRNWPQPVVDATPPALPASLRGPAVLIFSKTNGYRDPEQIVAANAALERLVRQRGWTPYLTENAAIFTPALLRRFTVVVFNSTSGDIFSAPQRAAFRQWLEQGGGLVALHGAGGDPQYAWQWYVHDVIGAQFTRHAHAPQFQTGTIRVEDRGSAVMRGLPAEWPRTEEWYSFQASPRGPGTHVLATLDEGSYDATPELRMADHPLIWERCVGRGRVFYSALGHRADSYAEPLHLRLIGQAIRWAGRDLEPGWRCP